MLQVLNPLSGIGQLFLGHLPHLLVALFLQKGQAVLHILLCLLVLLIGLHNRSQVSLLLHEPGKTLGILGHIRVTQHKHQFFIMNQHIIQLIKHIYLLLLRLFQFQPLH